MHTAKHDTATLRDCRRYHKTLWREDELNGDSNVEKPPELQVGHFEFMFRYLPLFGECHTTRVTLQGVPSCKIREKPIYG